MPETVDHETKLTRTGLSCLETRLALWSAIFCLIVMAYVHAVTWRPNCDFSTDGPYHVAMADLFTRAAIGRTFPWTQLSMWRDCFYDKELGFHLFLLTVRRWGGLFGYRGDTPPFLLETFALVVVWLLAFYWALARLGVRQAYIFLPAVSLLCPLFTDRLNLVRPHVFAIALLVMTATVVCSMRDRRRLVTLFGLGFLLSYIHSNPHFILLPTGCYALLAVREEHAHAFLPCLAAGAGNIAGLVIHPQFPNTFLVWKVQCIDVPLHALSGNIALSSPVELGAPAFSTVLNNGAVFIFPAIVIVGLLWKRQAPDKRLRLMLFLSILTCLGFLRTKRLIEYAVPFSVMALALAYDKWFAQRPRWFHGTVLALVAAGCLLMVPRHRAQFNSATHIEIPRHFAEWARPRIPPGTYIANLFWTDFPRLFFVAPEYRYSCGLDPMFGYAADPERMMRIEALGRGKAPLPPPAEMKELLGTGLVFVGIWAHPAARRMAERGYSIAYQGLDGWCFNLDAPIVDHKLGSAGTTDNGGE